MRIREELGSDQNAWDRLAAKKAQLESSTLGSLIKILERHSINSSDIAYLRWIKDKRDYFIHRRLHERGWPEDLDKKSCHQMRRCLNAIQIWLERGERNIWFIFERANLLELTRFRGGSMIAMNVGQYNAIRESVAEMASRDRQAE